MDDTLMKHMITISIVLVVFATGIFSTWTVWNYTANRLSDEAMQQAVIVAQSIDQQRLRSLKGDLSDLSSKDYVRIKEQLTQIRLAHSKCRFLYLIGRRDDGTVFFYLDSHPPSSIDYAYPGLVYAEVSKEYIKVFDTGIQQTVGPIKDRWGTLMTSLVPIYLNESNNSIAILGMDIDAKDWRKEIVSQALLPASLTISIILLITIFMLVNRHRKVIQHGRKDKKKHALELKLALQHIKKLQALLPICSSCNKIRDDKDYLDQIKSYIKENPDLQLSHGLCKECSIKLRDQEALYNSSKEKPASEL